MPTKAMTTTPAKTTPPISRALSCSRELGGDGEFLAPGVAGDLPDGVGRG